MNADAAVRRTLGRSSLVTSIDLVGSRARGDSTELSDWDFRVDSDDMRRLVDDLPTIARTLDPLGALWDPLSERAVYMLVLDGPVKIDLFPGDEPRPVLPPWVPMPDTLADIDAHFWDWTLWLGSKFLHGAGEVVDAELQKQHTHLLGPMGASAVPTTIEDAVAAYLAARALRMAQWRVVVAEELGRQVTGALARHHVIHATNPPHP